MANKNRHSEAKAKEFWIKITSDEEFVFVEEPDQELNATHLIEKSAYDKAVEALKEIANQPESEWCSFRASRELKELGEAE